MNTEERIAAVLAQHNTWNVRIMKGLMVCAGPICDWSAKPVRGVSSADLFRQHQADMIAAATPLPEPAPPAHREDLTMFAALIARLGGEVTITHDEATRLVGVSVVRYDDPETLGYRFGLTVPDFGQPSPDPTHQCESWMIRRGDTGTRYCASCGADQ